MKLITCLIVALSMSACCMPRGPVGATGAQGPIGVPGNEGPQGPSGADGSNGQDAEQSPYTPVGLINPCGDAPGIIDEVFIKLSNGDVIVSFSDDWTGHNTRFSVLPPGTYETSDGDHCVFSINSAGELTYENHRY